MRFRPSSRASSAPRSRPTRASARSPSTPRRSSSPVSPFPRGFSCRITCSTRATRRSTSGRRTRGGEMSEQDNILEIRGVTKRFPGVLALDDVSFRLGTGEVHALVGENGAGKSTLIKVVTGVHRPDEGEIFFAGERVSFASPREAQEAGISTIYQDTNMVPLRSVVQNIFLGREPRNRFGLTDTARMKREAEELLGRYGIEADVTVPVRSLG